MKHLDTIRVFADHYQFWVYDSEHNPFESLPEYTDESVNRGWQRTPYAISFSTRAHLNDHKLDVFFCETQPDLNEADRVTSHPMSINSGLNIHDTEDSFKCVLAEGEYTLILAAYNLGKEQDHSEEELEDNEFFLRTNWERYELYICNYQSNKDASINDS